MSKNLTNRKRRIRTRPLSITITTLGLGIIFLSTIFIQTPNIVPSGTNTRYFLKIVPLLMILLVTAVHYYKCGTHRLRGISGFALANVLFVVMMLVSMFRGVLNGTTSVAEALFNSLLVTSLWIFVNALYLNVKNERFFDAKMINALSWSIALFLLLNYVLFVLGIHGVSRGTSVFLDILGVYQQRIRFALSDGWNSFGVLSGAAIIVGLMFQNWSRCNIRKTRNRALSVVCLLAGLAGVIAVDSRGALLASVITFAFVRTCLLFSPNILKITPIVFPFSILFIYLVMSSIAQLGWLDSVSRTGSDFGENNSRLLVWGAGLERLNLGEIETYIGYGYRGNIPSGIVDDTYSDLVRLGAIGIGEEQWLTMHNSYMQYLIDLGIVGVMLYIFLTVAVTKKLLVLHQAYPLVRYDVILGLFFFYLVSSSLEVSTTIYHEGFVLFILSVFFVSSTPINSVARKYI